MADDKYEPRETNWRTLLPWTEIFQGFRLALDPSKLILAAAGILTMAFGWWLLALIFYSSSQPQWPGDYKTRYPEGNQAWAEFKQDRDQWNLMHLTAGPGDAQIAVDAADLAETPQEYDYLDQTRTKTVAQIQEEGLANKTDPKLVEKAVALHNPTPHIKAAGRLRTWPFFEPRGPNPYLLVTGQAGEANPDGTKKRIPWERGHFADWLLTQQIPVLIEPLVKLVEPVVFFFHPKAGFRAHFYLLLVILVTVATWALFGGAITRIAAVQIARKEKPDLKEAVRFTLRRYLSYVTGPLFPLVLAAILVVFMILFGFVHLVPVLGELVDGVLWWLMLALGLVMALVLIGLVGWPLMSATISAEGTDSWEAVSRSYSYVFQAPWHYIWNSLVALAYGAVLIFFVGLMGSLMVFFAKWGVSQTPGSSYFNRDPSYLFVYAPTSFGWRELLLSGTKVGGEDLVYSSGGINEDAYRKYTGNDPDYQGKDKMSGVNHFGAVLVSVWLYLAFLLILGFGYSYFWSASTIIYLLMRRKVDDAEMDEVYLEEEEEDLYREPTAPAPPPPPAGTVSGPARTMVEAPTLRVPPASAPPATPPPAVVTPPPPSPTPAAPSAETTAPPAAAHAPAEGGGNSPLGGGAVP